MPVGQDKDQRPARAREVLMGRRLGPCRGKVRHSCKGHAVIALKRVGNAGLSAYPCQRCGGWHVGTSNRSHKQQARLDQLFAQIHEADAKRRAAR